MEGLFQPTHLLFFLLILLVGVPILLIVRAHDHRSDQGLAALRQQGQSLPEILHSLEKINSTLERIEHKLEPIRKGD